MLGGPARGLGTAVLVVATACSPGVSEPTPSSTPLRLSAVLTQDSRDAARDRVAVVVANESGVAVTPAAIGYADPRLSGPLTGGRLRAIPAGGERRFPLPLVDPVCDGRDDGSARLSVRVGSEEVAVPVVDEVQVVARWVERRCAELAVADVAPLAFTGVVVSTTADSADLVLTATPTGEGSGAYVIETVAGTPVFTSTDEPWTPEATVAADGPPVEVLLPTRPARCDGHVFGESAGATSFLVGVRLDGQRREVVVRMSPGVAAEALGFAVAACRDTPPR